MASTATRSPSMTCFSAAMSPMTRAHTFPDRPRARSLSRTNGSLLMSIPQTESSLDRTNSPARWPPDRHLRKGAAPGAKKDRILPLTRASDENGNASRIASAAGVSSRRAWSSTGPMDIFNLLNCFLPINLVRNFPIKGGNVTRGRNYSTLGRYFFTRHQWRESECPAPADCRFPLRHFQLNHLRPRKLQGVDALNRG